MLGLAAILLAALAQKAPPDVCPYCKNDPKLLAAAGLVGHGPMPYGKSNSDEVKKFLSYTNPIFLETKHLRVASLLETYKVPENDWKTFEAELLRLKKQLPSVSEKIRSLDPWLRLHLFGMRCEERYARFLDLIKLKDESFPEVKVFGAPYMGEGKYLGMKDKYEVFFHANQRTFTDFLREHSGSTTKLTKREHYTARGALAVVIPVIEDLRVDQNLNAHLTHNLGHLFLLGYKHYAYEPPVWLEEGFAHFFEKEVSEEYNSFDSEEAAVAEMYAGSDWHEGMLRILERKKAAPLSELVHRKGFSDINKEDHLTCWSKVDFLIRAKPDLFSKFAAAMRGRVNKEGYPDGSNLVQAERDFFKAECNWSFVDFDREWEKWMQKVYFEKKKR